jgi:hypothetical protein
MPVRTPYSKHNPKRIWQIKRKENSGKVHHTEIFFEAFLVASSGVCLFLLLLLKFIRILITPIMANN